MREIGVIFRQGEYCVQVVGENDDGFDCEGVLGAGLAEGEAQARDVIEQFGRLAVGESDREEEGAAGHKVTTIVHHDLVRSTGRLCNDSVIYSFVCVVCKPRVWVSDRTRIAQARCGLLGVTG